MARGSTAEQNPYRFKSAYGTPNATRNLSVKPGDGVAALLKDWGQWHLLARQFYWALSAAIANGKSDEFIKRFRTLTEDYNPGNQAYVPSDEH